MQEVIYEFKSLEELEILNFIKKVNNDFFPSLSERFNIKDYSKKLVKNAVIVVAKANKKIVGCCAFYANDIVKKNAYISFIAILSNYRNIGIASNIIRNVISYLHEKNFKSLDLEVYKNNTTAIAFYLSKGFEIKSQNKKSYFLSYSLL